MNKKIKILLSSIAPVLTMPLVAGACTSRNYNNQKEELTKLKTELDKVSSEIKTLEAKADANDTNSQTYKELTSKKEIHLELIKKYEELNKEFKSTEREFFLDQFVNAYYFALKTLAGKDITNADLVYYSLVTPIVERESVKESSQAKYAMFYVSKALKAIEQKSVFALNGLKANEKYDEYKTKQSALVEEIKSKINEISLMSTNSVENIKNIYEKGLTTFEELSTKLKNELNLDAKNVSKLENIKQNLSTFKTAFEAKYTTDEQLQDKFNDKYVTDIFKFMNDLDKTKRNGVGYIKYPESLKELSNEQISLIKDSLLSVEKNINSFVEWFR
ncbi:Uncharacterised protein [Mycoplasmopsis maculosa]|uniref:Lipoprotein n=1 Tax=Mycoplasmopsis maculosa TaxID=114885 RepID=A0A449B560_9BACT|nr:hypothetical protein [Mycoplasmopsis maculosa]VEU75706.1 Uncharacterised protein [Mycoplasmopsis maculosa]